MQYPFQPSPINMYDPHIKSLVFINLLYLCLCRFGQLPKNSLFHVSDLSTLTLYQKI
jgi:hypothetical protein